jgi:hypothetical protein
MDLRFRESKQQKFYNDIYKELPDVKLLEKGIKLGTASLLVAISNWCDALIDGNVETISPKEIKEALLNGHTHDIEIQKYVEEFLEE